MNRASIRLIRDELSRQEILRYLGYRGQEVGPELSERFDRAIDGCLAHIRPVYVWREFPLEFQPDGVLVSGTNVRLTGKGILRHLNGAKMAALLAATLGAEAERYLRALEHTDMTGALIADAVCTECVEKTCDRAGEEIRAFAARGGYSVNSRFSPGYGDLPLEIQPEFLSALDSMKAIGLTCSSSFLLIPRKSVTAVIGFFSGERETEKEPPCASCNLRRNCIYRKAGTSCGHQETDR